MENNQNAPVSPEQVSGVWLSREEYERLRNATNQPNMSPPVQGVVATPVKDSKKDFWTYAGGAAALLIFIGMSAGSGTAGSWLMLPMAMAVIIFAGLAIRSLIVPARRAIAPQGTVVAPSGKSNAGKIVLIILGLIVLLPVAPFLLMIVFLFIIAATGQEIGS